ncbi:MAG: helix-turn-helix domain-containing protein, partial [Gammaproteobacteria bacterium]|nr:helix-turn-helix domain-containing protein [Gammaproteobacteria bacterium]
MIASQLKLTKRQQESLEKTQVNAEKAGDYQKKKRILSIWQFSRKEKRLDIAKLLKGSHEAVRNWFKNYLLKGLLGLRSVKIPGRPSKLTKSQRKELSKIIKAGPEKAGFPGACWRTPMIQHLIQKLYG